MKKDFPIYTSPENLSLTYLDSTATALKPQQVIDAIHAYYSEYSSNVHRGLYPLSQRATDAYEQARSRVARFIGAQNDEIIFTSGTTDGINMVANWMGNVMEEGDEIVTTVMEHHSNFVSWREIGNRGRVKKIGGIRDIGEIRVIELHKNNERLDIFDVENGVDGEVLKRYVSKKTKLFAIHHVSNVFGITNPINELVTEIKKINPQCLVFIDGAQAVPHMKVDVADLGCDFYAFSGHKMCGPTGIGVLWGKMELLERMEPMKFGGEMIQKVSLDETTYNSVPHKFEAGTPHIAGAIGLGAAVEYLEGIGMEKVEKREKKLTRYILEHLERLEHLQLYGPRNSDFKSGIVTFNLFDKNGKLIHPHDVAQILGDMNICIRAGHHCTQPLHDELEIAASCRASLYLYNDEKDVERLVEGLEEVLKIF